MNTRKQPHNMIPWAWAVGWMLVSLGMVISDVFSRPSRGMAAYSLLGFAGWAVGAAGTIFFVRRRYEAGSAVLLLSALGWVLGGLAALVLGASWMTQWNVGFLASPVAIAIGGAAGGGLTLPMRIIASPGAVARNVIRGAIVWGLTFLLFQVLAFYTGYFLMILTVNWLHPMVGDLWAKAPGWALPAGICGFFAGWVVSKMLR